MKVSTRQYAKRQTKWIRNKLLPTVNHVSKSDDNVVLYLLDATGKLANAFHFLG